MTMRKWWAWPLVWAGCVLAAGLNPGAGHAEYRGGTIKIGVLNDQSGLYADIAGTASVWMARKAVEDFGAAAKGMKVEIVGGDHQNKPSPNTVHWIYDTWALANGTGNAIVKRGGDSWFFLTADYAFGYALERDTEAVVVKSGGKVLGKVRHPFPGTDFASSLLQAKVSKAK